MSDFMFPLLYGPTGRDLVVDASGRLIVNGTADSDAYVLGYGSTGREVVVDASGRFILSALSTGLGGGAGTVTGAENLGAGSGLYSQLSGGNLQFRSISAGENIAISGSAAEIRISASTSGTAAASTITLVDASGFVTGSDAETAFTETGEKIFYQDNTGFVGWNSASASPYWTASAASGFIINNGGFGYVRGKRVSWEAGLSGVIPPANTTYYYRLDEDGVISHDGTQGDEDDYRDYMYFARCWRDGSDNFMIIKENHPYNFPHHVSAFFHFNIGTTIREPGGDVARIATGTGASADDRRLKTTQATTVDDHGLNTTFGITNPISWKMVYKTAGGKWEYESLSASEFPMKYNSGGTPTAITSGRRGVYRLYVTLDSIDSATPQFIAVMHTAQYTTLGAAESVIGDNTAEAASGELLEMAMAHIGFIVVRNNATSGYIEDVTIFKSTFGQHVGGGGNEGDAVLVDLDVTNFDGALDATDTNVQVAMDTLDDNWKDFTNASGVWDNDIAELQATSGFPTASDISVVDASGFYNSVEVESALQEAGEREWYHDQTGTIKDSVAVATTIQNGSGLLGITTAGRGYIRGQQISYAAQSGIQGVASGTTRYFYIDNAGILQLDNSPASVSDYRDKMYLARAWCDGTNILASVENHKYNFPASVSWYLHKNPGTTVRIPGGDLARVAEGSGASADDRRLNIEAATLDDHGLEASMPATNPVIWNHAYTLGTGKWKVAATQSDLLVQYNNAGTPTGLGAGKYGVYRFYVAFPQNTGDNCQYIAVMDDAQYDDLSSAQDVLSNNTHSAATGELSTLGPAQLGSVIVYNDGGGYIYSVTISKDTFFTKSAGGNEGTAALVGTDTAAFGGILSAADSNVQIALETIDDHTHAVETDFTNASGVWTADIATATGEGADFANASGNMVAATTAAQAAADSVQTEFTNASGVWTTDIATATGEGTDFTNSSGVMVAATATAQASADSVQTDFTNASGNIGSDLRIQGTKLYLDGEQLIYNANTEFINSFIFGNGGNNLSHIILSEGYYNTFVGRGAGTATTSGGNNTFIGSNAGTTNEHGSRNTYVGSNAGRQNTDGMDNVDVGLYAGYSNTSGYENTCLGTYAGLYSTTGHQNTFVGSRAGINNITGSGNIFIGHRAGRFQQDGTNLQSAGKCTYIGNYIRGKDNTDENAIAIGNEAIGSGSNTTVIGNNLITETYLYGDIYSGDNQLVIFASNLGAGSGLYGSKSGETFQFKSIVAGNNISLSGTATELTISSTGGGAGETNTASNLGTGSGLFAQKSTYDLQFKSLKPGNSIGIDGTATDLTIKLMASGTVATYNTGTRTVADNATDQHSVLTTGIGDLIQEGIIGRVTLEDVSSLGAGDVTVKIYNDFGRSENVYERVYDLAQTPLTDYLPTYFMSASGGAMYFDIVNNTGSAGDFSVEARCSTVLSVPVSTTAAGSGVTSDSAGDGLSYSNPRLSIDLASDPGLELTGASPSKQLQVKAGDGISTDATGINVDSTVLRTTGDQNIAGLKNFTDHAFGIAPHPDAGPPTSGTYKVGAFFLDSSEILYQCTAAGTPGDWQFWGWSYSQGIEIGETAGNDGSNYTTDTVLAGATFSSGVSTGISTSADGGRRGVIRKLNVWAAIPAWASGTLDIPFRINAYPNENYYGREQLWSIQGQARQSSFTVAATGGVSNELTVDDVNTGAPDDLTRLRRKDVTIGEEYARITVRNTGTLKYSVDEAVLNDFVAGDVMMFVTEFVELPWTNNSAVEANRDKIYLKIYNDDDTSDAIFGFELDVENIGGGPAIS